MRKSIKYLIIFLFILGFMTACGKTTLNEEDKNTKVVDTYTWKYENLTFTPGEKFDKDIYSGYNDYVELPSCAFEDIDREYIYDHYEITTYTLNNEERILSVYFIDPEIKTTEGISLGDEYAKMIDTYGEGYEKLDNLYKYIKGDTALEFIVENDVITSIEYSYVISE